MKIENIVNKQMYPREPMKSYKIIAHTADVRLQVTGTTLPELFLAAIDGMNHIIKPHQSNQKREISHKITLSSPDTTTLLIDFLSAVLTKTQVTKNIFCSIEFEQFHPTNIVAIIYGHAVNAFSEDIKAVTYHEANIIKNQKGDYQTTIIFDI